MASLYLKYRPNNFENLVGQKYIKTTLINALKQKQVAHAYLFTGPRGTGKTSSARLIAKAINCANPEDGYEPCNQCELCQDINQGKLIDLIEIDAASNRGIDEVRDLKEKINFAPTRAKVKIYIIDEVHMMTKEAFNALLKTLEEPPSHTHFILATTEVHKIPETIISRCQRFDFRRMTMDDLCERLGFIAKEEGIEIEEQAIRMIAKYVDGGMRDAIGILDQLNQEQKITLANVKEVLGVSDQSLLENLYKSLQIKDAKIALRIIEELHMQGSDLRRFSHDFIELLRQKMLSSVEEKQGGLTHELLNWISIFEESQSVTGSIPQLPLEIAVIKISGVAKIEEKKVEMVSEVPDKIAEKKPLEKDEIPEPVKEVAQEREHKTILNIENIRSKWLNILEGIKVPSLRMSLKNAKILKLEGNTLLLGFGTNFHKEKADETENKNLLEESISKVLGQKLKVETVIDESSEPNITEMMPEPMAMPTEIDSFDVKEEKKPENGKLVDAALDIFGGELV